MTLFKHSLYCILLLFLISCKDDLATYEGKVGDDEMKGFLTITRDSAYGTFYYEDDSTQNYDLFLLTGTVQKEDVLLVAKNNQNEEVATIEGVFNRKRKTITATWKPIDDTEEAPFNLKFKKQRRKSKVSLKGANEKQFLAKRRGKVSVKKDLVYATKKGYWQEQDYNLAYDVAIAKWFERYTYKDALFDEGFPLGNSTADDLDLKLDLYLPPKGGKSSYLRPLVILAHGGGFLLGSKENKSITSLATELAKHGYVVASINYRMGFIIKKDENNHFENIILNAVNDMHSSISYLVAHKSEYRISENHIVVGGMSAGSFTALHTAFWDADEIANLEPSSYKVTAVLNLWGAMTDLEDIDAEEAIPIINFHGAKDNVVPIGYDFPFKEIKIIIPFLDLKINEFALNKVYGAKEIVRKSSVDNRVRLSKIFDFNSGHSPHLDPKGENFNDNFSIIKKETVVFLSEVLNMKTGGTIDIERASENVYYANFQSLNAKWKAQGGEVLFMNKTKTQVYIKWNKKGKNRRIILQLVDELGIIKKIVRNGE
jgi:dienelactone hydrolase